MHKPIWQQHTGRCLGGRPFRTGPGSYSRIHRRLLYEDEIPASDTSAMPVETPVILPRTEAFPRQRRSDSAKYESESGPSAQDGGFNLA